MVKMYQRFYPEFDTEKFNSLNEVFELPLEKTISSLSKGQKMRLAIMLEICHKPKYLIMDEPTSGLDPISTKEVKTLIKALSAGGMTVLTTSHLLADSQDICDRVMIVNHGKSVAEGRVSDMAGSLEDFFLAKVGKVDEFVLADFLA
jgi:ABC-2 type transport system ATP-binding protein